MQNPVDLIPNHRCEFRERFLRWVHTYSATDERESEWGPPRAIDGHVLAAFVMNDAVMAGDRWDETLTMILGNMDYEREDTVFQKWHLADFALHPLLRGYGQFRSAFTGPEWTARWENLQHVISEFIWHDGDLSENHNMLHWSAQLLIADFWPTLVYMDGRTAADHQPAVRERVLAWMREWVGEGSGEWGSDIYYNVNLLSLYNLADLSHDPEIQTAARGTIDWLMADQALDRIHGAIAGAARRSYAVYRQDLRDSPSRPLQWLYWGENPEETAFFNPWFIGGAILAAVSSYEPPAALTAIARDDASTVQHQATHWKGAFGTDQGQPVSKTVSRHSLRSPHGLISTLISPGGINRFTEQVWQVTLGERALIFSNHPQIHHPLRWGGKEAEGVFEDYRTGRPGVFRRYWVVGNMPPGQFGDFRPGYWQGNGYGPRSFGWDDQSAVVYDIPPDDRLPFVHVWFPQEHFDETVHDGQWLFARKGLAVAAVWTSHPTEPLTGNNLWRKVERRIPAPRCALRARMGCLTRESDFADWIESEKTKDIHFDTGQCTLHVGDLELNYEKGPSRKGEAVPQEFHRYQTPWGNLPHGETSAVWTVGDKQSRLGF